jgi:hypothetical protein
MAELVAEFDQLPRSGETVYGFAAGVFPTDQPTLPSGGEYGAWLAIENSGRSGALDEPVRLEPLQRCVDMRAS